MIRAPYQLPPDKQQAARRARRLAWLTLAAMASVAAAVGLSMGSSQTMQAEWIENLLGLVPPLAFLTAQRVRRRPPDARFPYGYERAASIAFLGSAAALFMVGLYVLADSALTLLRRERPALGLVAPFGTPLWAGWPMLAALAYSAAVPWLLARLKLPLARELHDKTLYTDVAMGKAEWLTSGAGMLGVLGIGAGLWWTDAAAAALIALDIARDGAVQLREAAADLADRRPLEFDRGGPDPLAERIAARLEQLPWVERAQVRLREEGEAIDGEAFVVPRECAELPERLREASFSLRGLDWRIHEIVLVALPALDEPAD